MAVIFVFMDLINGPWLILLAYWVISSFRVRATERAQPAATSFFCLGLVTVGFALLFGHWFQSTFLGQRFVPDLLAIRYLGIFLIWIGIAIAIWARYHLGEYWSARVTIKVGHKVIDSGPYSYVRHPIYSGILLAMIGTALAVGKWRQLAAFFLILIVFLFKARREEGMLTGQPGEMYLEYKRRTGMLIPWLGRA